VAELTSNRWRCYTALRDATLKGLHGPVLGFTADDWEAFISGVQDGEFSLPATVCSTAIWVTTWRYASRTT
jgi:hypothetical protein